MPNPQYQTSLQQPARKTVGTTRSLEQNVPFEIGQRLKVRLERLRMGQRELAAKAGYVVRGENITRVCLPKIDRIRRIREMAALGNRSEQIAVSVGVNPEHVRKLARDTQADHLFHLDKWPNSFRQNYCTAKTSKGRAKVAAARIDHFIATGE